jgi:hypothetical protein
MYFPYNSGFSRGTSSLHRGSPPSSGIGKARGLILLAMSAGVAGTASVVAVEERSSQDVQKPPAGWDKNVSWAYT